METRAGYTPVLGLGGDGAVERAAETRAVEERSWPLELTVVVPARDEMRNLPGCLRSLLAQDERVFRLGVDWELVVVDDGSEDGTRAFAEELRDEVGAENEGFRVLEAPVWERGSMTGKANACWTGASVARGRWLLFTDADTVHEAGDLRRAMLEAERFRVALLSYSPRQVVTGVAQHLVMPLIFSELATVYPPRKVNDAGERLAAANGQFLLVEHGVYRDVGGHRTVGRSVLEDVDLAQVVKRGKRAIRLRYAPEQVSARMYASFGEMVEGWTKNLALLFPHAVQLALWRMLDGLLFCLPLLVLALPYLVLWQKGALLLLWVRTLVRFYQRVARSGFGFVDCALSVFGLPLFCFLLVTSWWKHKSGAGVRWKGRVYR